MSVDASRRDRLLAGAALPLRLRPGPVPSGTGSDSGPARLGVEELCQHFHHARRALPSADEALRQAMALVADLQAEVHRLEDAPSRAVTALETMPAQTVAEAEAKVAVGRILVAEGRDPERHTFLAAAEAELAALKGGCPTLGGMTP
ncbi:hypothetical protein JYK14_02910 [Siccirubricoccus sp. KC 17139]|uniref:Uncharacterized protein n=1 Tax=Siccirubricoccus soli TaxID=2899147 RepID=A0ABT1D0D5_9PROT|nr:hypothetical protein [Siccirubricoccus soli]MCO6415127.1 hypothetical protein [Siccirubricoccus soli]MCP2681258.1 hypothetical protein [Siccirubricoccus soli]